MRRALLSSTLAMVAGGLPPPRPDQVSPSTSAGVTPGTKSGSFRGRLVVVFGTGPGSGIFVYDGNPVNPASHLIASITATGGTDPQGRSYNAGITSYDNVFGGVTEILGAVINLFSGVTLEGTLSPSGLVIGASGGPQVKALVGANIALTTSMPGTGTAAADISSLSNLQQVYQAPSGNANEVQPATIGTTLITYTSGEVATGLLTLSPLLNAASPFGHFTLHLAVSRPAGTKAGGLISGLYNIISGKITLQPRTVQQDLNANMDLYVGGVKMIAQAGANLIPVEENWRYVGTGGNPAFQNGWSNFGSGNANLAFKLLAAPDQAVWIKGILLGGTAATIFTLPSSPFNFQPVSHQIFTGFDTTAGGAVRFQVSNAGVVSLLGTAAAHEYQLEALVSLDI